MLGAYASSKYGHLDYDTEAQQETKSQLQSVEQVLNQLRNV